MVVPSSIVTRNSIYPEASNQDQLIETNYEECAEFLKQNIIVVWGVLKGSYTAMIGFEG